MSKIPTAEEILSKKFSELKSSFDLNDIKDCMVEFAKLHTEAALKEASKKAKITERKVTLDNTGGYVRVPTIYKKYILNSYPLENIK